MTNYERYAKELARADGCEEVAAVTGRTCEVGDDCGACMRAVMAWAAAEYEEQWPAGRLAQVAYIEHAGHYSFIHYAGGTVEKARVRQSRLEEILEPWARFITAAKGVIINLDYVQEIAAGESIMADGARLPVSRRRAAEVGRYYEEYKKTSRCGAAIAAGIKSVKK